MYLLIVKKNKFILFLKKFNTLDEVENFLTNHKWLYKYQLELFYRWRCI